MKTNLFKIINESKNIGIIYHVCTLNAMIKHVIPTDSLSGSGKWYNSVFNSKDIVSFTRDKKYITPVAGLSPVFFQFVVDGKKLSEKYKIKPFNNRTKSIGFSEAEESVLGTITNFRKYIISVNFYVSEEIVNYLEDKTKLKKLVKDIATVDDYLLNIDNQQKEEKHSGNCWYDYFKSESKELESIVDQIRDCETITDLFIVLNSLQNKQIRLSENKKLLKESPVKFNQKGYSGQSMSVRAKQAYDSGEMPKSKWTKSAIIDALEDAFGENAIADFKKFSKDTLFTNLCKYSSWHHTGKFANATEFYSFDPELALLFADENNLKSMQDVLKNDENYQKLKKEREKTKQAQDKEKQDYQDKQNIRKELAYNLYNDMPEFLSTTTTPIESILHRGDEAFRFSFQSPNNWMFSIHAYENDLEELEQLYADLKNKKHTKKTDSIYKFVAYISSDNIELDLDGVLYKGWNVKQLPITGIPFFDF